MAVLSPPLAWDALSNPEEMNSTLYWSEEPPFTLSSIGLGVETVHLAASAYERPLLVIVFAPSNGLPESNENHQLNLHEYTIEVRIAFV